MSSVRRPDGRLFQIRGPAVPKLLLRSCCANVAPHTLSEEDRRDRRLPSGTRRISSARYVGIWAQCLVHQTGEFELHSPQNRKPVQLTQHQRNVVTTSGSGDEACCGILQGLDSPHDVHVYMYHTYLVLILLQSTISGFAREVATTGSTKSIY